MRKPSLIGLLLLVGVLGVAATAVALAGGGNEPQTDDDVSAEERAAYEDICGPGEEPCTFINTNADPAAGDGPGEGSLVKGTDLVQRASTKSADECPEAKAAYDAAGQDVDGFIGGCPDSSELP